MQPEACHGVPLANLEAPSAVEGLALHPDFVSEDEERELLRTVDAQPWDCTIRRRTQHYGRRFDYHNKTVGDEATPLPAEIRRLILERVDVQPALLPWRPAAGREGSLQCTVNEYPPGVGIAPHIDTHSAFEDGIASLSLGGGCAFRLRRGSDGADHSVWLPPRCLLVMSGAARYEWQHSISGRKFDRVEQRESPAGWEWVPRERRISVTLRRVLGSGRTCACAFPLFCDSRIGGAAIALPTRLAPAPAAPAAAAAATLRRGSH